MAYYRKHPDLVLPEDSSVIWRYRELGKFQLMLQWNSIFFSRADKQTDTLEAKSSMGRLIKLDGRLKDGFRSDDGNLYTIPKWHALKEIPSHLISCWCMDSNQSRKKWCRYTSSKESIVIRSTIERLKNCFHYKGEPTVRIGQIRYGEEENKLRNSVRKRYADI